MKQGILGMMFILCIAAGGFFLSSHKIMTNEEYEEMHQLPQVIRSVPIEEHVDFAGERIPIERHDVKERLDRELMVNSYWHSNTIQNIKLAHRFFPTIERILAEEGVPDDFKYLAVAESDLRLKTSYAGAKGYWQFMKASGKEYGLEINDEVDERYHIEKSTRAAAKYIKNLKKRFGTYVNAAAAYNVGPTRYKRNLAEQGSEKYYDLNLNDETSRYVFRVIAFKYLLSNPEKYGFFIQEDEKYAPLSNYVTETIEKSVSSWPNFAAERGISYRDFKIYNPWLKETKLTVIKNKYAVKVPRR